MSNEDWKRTNVQLAHVESLFFWQAQWTFILISKPKPWRRRTTCYLSCCLQCTTSGSQETLISLHIRKPVLRWSATLQQSSSSLLMHLSSANVQLLQRRKKHQLNVAACDGDRSLRQSNIIISCATCQILLHVLKAVWLISISACLHCQISKYSAGFYEMGLLIQFHKLKYYLN